MKKSKLITALRALSPKEIQEFDAYLQVFYTDQYIALQVWSYLRASYPFPDETSLDKKKAFFEIFPEEKDFSYRKITDALSDLYLWLEEYLVMGQSC